MQGCSSKSQCCCFESQTCCKVGGNLGLSCCCLEICPEFGCSCGDCCYNKCICCSGGLICCETCCLGQQHCCCLVNAFSFPCSDDVPCMCTLCPFLVLCPANGDCCGCCMKTGEVTGTITAAAQPLLVVQQQQQVMVVQQQRPQDPDMNRHVGYSLAAAPGLQQQLPAPGLQQQLPVVQASRLSGSFMARMSLGQQAQQHAQHREWRKFRPPSAPVLRAPSCFQMRRVCRLSCGSCCWRSSSSSSLRH